LWRSLARGFKPADRLRVLLRREPAVHEIDSERHLLFPLGEPNLGPPTSMYQLGKEEAMNI
jgi:hypothetical protein